MNGDDRINFARLLAMTAVLLNITPGFAEAQRVPVTSGSIVRVSRPDSAGQPYWSTGRVVYASRDQLLLDRPDVEQPLIRYNEVFSLQVRRGERTLSAPLGGLGMGIGAIVGMKSLKAAESRSARDGASFGPTIVGGVVGGVIGAIVGRLIRSTSWEEVPLQDGQIAVAPLDESGTQTEFSLSRTVRWTRFEPTTANFQAFFEAHSSALNPVEGIWVRTGTHLGIVIVRVEEREETYAAYRLRPDIGPSHPSDDGLMIFALTPGSDDESDWRFQIARESPRKHKATVVSGVLRLEYPGGAVDQWDRWFPN